MLKNFDEMDPGTVFLNSFTHTACMKISPTRYFDMTLKHSITMRKDLMSHPHLTVRVLCTTEDINNDN